MMADGVYTKKLFTVSIFIQKNFVVCHSEKISYDKSKEISIGLSEKGQIDYQLSKDYEPYDHRQVEHPLT